MNPLTSDALTGQTAALLTAPDINEMHAASDVNVRGATRDAIDKPASAGASTPTSSGGRERIHQFAGVLHQAIDKVEQTFGGKRGAGSSTASGYTSQAEGGTVLGQFKTQPLRSAGMALAGVLVLKKVLGRSSTARDVQVKVVQVPVPHRGLRDYSRPFIERRASAASGWFKGAGQQLGSLPYQMRRATNGLMAKGQQYGAVASAGVRTYPMAGLGVTTAAAALLTTVMLRRRTSRGSGYGAVDSRLDTGNLRRTTAVRTGAAELVASRPVASAAVLLGVGALLGVMMRRS